MLYLHDTPSSVLPVSVHVSPLAESSVSAGSGLLRGDMKLQAKHEDVCVCVCVSVCVLFCCLLPNVCFHTIREYICMCVLSPFVSFQIGTGFKDEDLEQHFNFLKVTWLSHLQYLFGRKKITTWHLFSHMNAFLLKRKVITRVFQHSPATQFPPCLNRVSFEVKRSRMSVRLVFGALSIYK